MPSLRDQLEARRQGVSDEVRRAYEAMVSALRHTGFVEQLLQVGDRFPDLALPDAKGELVAIAGLLRRGPLVATFFRGEWCPYCRLTLDALAAALPEFQMAGARLVAITPERRWSARSRVSCLTSPAIYLQGGDVGPRALIDRVQLHVIIGVSRVG